MECEICKSTESIQEHHLSYDPIIIVPLCYKCHRITHYLPRINEDQLNRIREWVRQYSHLWIKGSWDNKETQRFRQRRYRERNKNNIDYLEHRNSIQRKYSKKNREKILANARQWRLDNPEKAKEKDKRGYENRKQKIGVPAV